MKVVTWDSQLAKGVDDLIAAYGEEAFTQAYQKANNLDTWQAQCLTSLTSPAAINLDCPYLPATLPIPETCQLIAIKSPKGSGKTQFLEKIVAQARARQQRVLVIGHRIKLVQALCQRFGLPYITEVREQTAAKGYGLCIDSLHPHSQAQFVADNWDDSIIIIDEVEQVLWHGLNSDTCRDKRVAILKSLKTLMQNVLGGQGKVYVADADLSDVSLDYLLSLAGVHREPFIIRNHWQPNCQQAWRTYHYPDSSPQRLVSDLERHIREGGKPLVCLSAQTRQSQWGTCILEIYLQKQFPQKQILRLDSESLADPSHPAYDCMGNLDEVLGNYDIVLASPALETGISIDLRGHFTSVWGIVQGVQTVQSVCQALERLRENVPRYLWIASFGFNQVGNGATSISNLLSSNHRLTQDNIRRLQKLDFEAIEDLDLQFQAESLLCWAKMAVRVNAGMLHYRESILSLLQEEGHLVMAVACFPDILKTQQVRKKIKKIRDEHYQAECQAVASASPLSDRKYHRLKQQRQKTLSQKYAERKHELELRYGLAVTPQLVIADNEGWYEKLRLHYFLTLGRSHLAQRDAQVAKTMMLQGEGHLFLPDFNNSQLGNTIGLMELLGIPQLLANPERELTNLDEDLQRIAAIALQNRLRIKTAINIGIAHNDSPITIVRRFLELIGYRLQLVRCGGDNFKRIRVYQIVIPEDKRTEVFQYWLSSPKATCSKN